MKNTHLRQSPQSREYLNFGIRKIVFEGGLGSQLLPLLEKCYLDSRGIPFVVDTSYFNIDSKMTRTRGGADQRSFKLDFYGISLDSLLVGSTRITPELQVSQNRNFDLWDSDFWGFSSELATNLLPVDLELLGAFKRSIGIEAGQQYSVVHVRRGDYLRVASHIVSDSMWLGILEKVKSLTSDNLIISSDSKIPEKTKNEVKKITSDKSMQIIYLEGDEIDECALHDLMRSANLLIASNSTFSFSAAILSNPETFCVIPSIFYGDQGLEEINRGIRAAGDFFILN